MKPKSFVSFFSFRHLQIASHRKHILNRRGQALVEFTLVFVLLLVISWIPAEFGLAFYTGQLAQNAAREGARIAAADPTLTNGTCNMPCSSAPAGSALAATAKRIAGTAMLGAATITVLYPVAAGGCNKQVRVTVSGQYKFFFYQLLRLLGVSQPTNSANIVRFTDMRWEHQDGC